MKKYTILLVAAVSLLLSCRDYLEKYPLDAPSSANFPQSKDELTLAVNGVYNSLYKKNGGYIQDELFWDHATDLGYIRGGYESTEGIMTGSVTTHMFGSHWSHCYTGIQRANFILENMERAREVIDGNYCNQAEGEVKFLRAYHYMHLTERYGDVPLITSALSLAESKTPRTAKETVATLILDDLEYAASVLPDSYNGSDQGRVTKGAALALRARIALYNEKYEIAAQAASEVMKMDYTLHPVYGDLFQLAGNGSPEIIFQLSYHADVRPNNDHIFLGGRAGTGNWSTAVPTQFIVDSYLCTDGKPINESPLYDQANPYENRDPRLKQSIIVPQTWFGGDLFETHPDSTATWRDNGGTLQRITNLEVTNQYATFTGYLWRKNWDETQYWQSWANQGTLPMKVIRYAEILLIYAEAKIEQNQIDASVYNALNEIRNRAGMPEIPSGLSQSELRKLLRLERKIELAGEGFRLYDIRRWRIAEHVIPGNLPGRKNAQYWYSPGIPVINEHGHPVYANQDQVFKIIQVRRFNTNRDYLWAIPQSEMNINDLLEQNPGY